MQFDENIIDRVFLPTATDSRHKKACEKYFDFIVELSKITKTFQMDRQTTSYINIINRSKYQH